jgi:DNA modification methylase
MGSFTTAVCANRLKRKFIGAEIDKEYYQLGSQRLKNELLQCSLFDLL